MGLLTTLDISAEQEPRIRVRDTYLPASIEGYFGQDGARTITFFTSDILIITLLSNFLLQYVESKLGLGLSPSRQTAIRHNDSTGIRCYVRPYSPHYAPSLVLSNVPYFRSVCSVAIPSPNLLSTYCRRKLDNSVLLINIRGKNLASCTGPSTLGSYSKLKIPVEPVHAGRCSLWLYIQSRPAPSLSLPLRGVLEPKCCVTWITLEDHGSGVRVRLNQVLRAANEQTDQRYQR